MKVSSMMTTPLKSLKHRFKVKNEFNDDHAFEEFKDESDFNDDHAFKEFEVEKQVRSGPEIRSTDLHLLQVRGCRPIGSGNWD